MLLDLSYDRIERKARLCTWHEGTLFVTWTVIIVDNVTPTCFDPPI